MYYALLFVTSANVLEQVVAHGALDLDVFIKVAETVLVDEADWLPSAYQMWYIEQMPEPSEDEAGGASDGQSATNKPPPAHTAKARAPPKPTAASQKKTGASSKAPTRSTRSRNQAAEAKSGTKTVAAKGKSKATATNVASTRSAAAKKAAVEVRPAVEVESEDSSVDEEPPVLRKPTRKAAASAKAAKVQMPTRKRKADGSPVPPQPRKTKAPKTTMLVPSDDEADRAQDVQSGPADDELGGPAAASGDLEDLATDPPPTTQPSLPKRRSTKKKVVVVEVPAVRHKKVSVPHYLVFA